MECPEPSGHWSRSPGSPNESTLCTFNYIVHTMQLYLNIVFCRFYICHKNGYCPEGKKHNNEFKLMARTTPHGQAKVFDDRHLQCPGVPHLGSSPRGSSASPMLRLRDLVRSRLSPSPCGERLSPFSAVCRAGPINYKNNPSSVFYESKWTCSAKVFNDL